MIDFNVINKRALEHFDDVMDWLGLEGEYRGREFVALNPTRNDHELGSFSINQDTGRWADFTEDDAKGGDIASLVAYLKGIEQVPAARALEMFLDTLEDPAAPPPEETVHKEVQTSQDTLVSPIPAEVTLPTLIQGFGRPRVVYPYRNRAGEILFYVLRADLPGGTKKIRPLTLWTTVAGGTTWKLAGMPAPRPLYHLDLIAQHPDAAILIVEGEKAADAARALFPNGVVTTTPNGAQAVEHVDLTPLTGRAVILWPDHDEPGEAYVHHLKDRLLQDIRVGQLTIVRPAAYMPNQHEDSNGILIERTTPVAIGWDAADAVAEGWTAVHLQMLLEETESELVVSRSIDPFQAPTNYRVGKFDVSDEGVVAKIPENGKTPAYEVHVSSRIDVVALTRNNGNTDWGLLLKFGDPDGQAKEWAMPKEMLSGRGDEYRSTLLNMGACIGSDYRANFLLTEYLTDSKPETRALCTTTIGWHGDVFVLPEQTFGNSTERVILQTRNPRDHAAFATRGTLAEWQAHVGSLCAGNSRLILALCTALAGPLLKPLGEECGGFHLRGASSRGKTKALKVAGSVWGSGALIKTWRATSNGLEGVALQRNDTVLLLDELSQCTPYDASAAVYMLANGEGKARAGTTGAARQSSRWRLLFLSTGEIDLAQHIATAGHQVRAGQEVRFLDIPADAGRNLGLFGDLHGQSNAANFAVHLEEITGQYYGTLGPALLEYLTTGQGLERFRETTMICRDLFIKRVVPIDADGQISRAAGRFGLLAGIGEAAIEIGLLPWPEGHAYDGITECFSAWLDHRGGTVAMEELRALEQIRQILERDGDSRFDPLGSQDEADINLDGTRQIRDRLGFKHHNHEGRWEFWVFPEMYRAILCDGFDPKLVTQVLKSRGYLGIGKDGKTTIPKALPSLGTQRMYVILPAILGDEEEPQRSDDAVAT